MRLTIRLLGVELLDVDLRDSDDGPGACDATTYPVGFTTSPGDQRWVEHRYADTD